MHLEGLSIRIHDYKCFGESGYGYDEILPINLIIGRNNTGKSTLLDIIDHLTLPRDLSGLAHKERAPKVTISSTLSESELKRAFPENSSFGPIPGNHWAFGKKWIGKTITWSVNHKSVEFVSVDPPFELSNLDQQEKELAKAKGNPFGLLKFKRLQAERDIRPELADGSAMTDGTGEGATRTIQQFINEVSLPSDLVEGVVLSELNSIFEPDAHFTDIVTQRHPDAKWEIYLEEQHKGRIPLAHSGSGVKTVLLVLIFVHLIPYLERRPLSSYLFGFEELENNLHPALQRRLLLYLRKLAVEQECRFFLTTHSNVAIDLFARDDAAQILHVTHDGTCASVRRAHTYVENRGILDDLDVRASDLLQSNGVVWVEGPSDRLYFNRWIDIWSEGKLKEGAHYQCVYYGGRLLAHLSATDPDVESAEVVQILRVNRNAILIIDSDRAIQDEPLNHTKQRLVDEISRIGGMAWVTSGREIENYVPTTAVECVYGREAVSPLERYQEMAEYLDALVGDNEGKRFLRNKVRFAERIGPVLTKDDLVKTLDLGERLAEVLDHIRSWNGLS